METLAQRIRSRLDKHPTLSQAGLARHCHVKPPSVANWMNGRTKNLLSTNLQRAAQYLHTNQHWLATGEGNPDQLDGHALHEPAPPSSWPAADRRAQLRRRLLDTLDQLLEHQEEQLLQIAAKEAENNRRILNDSGLAKRYKTA